LSIELTTTPSRIDLDAALALLRQTYWAKEMTRETLAKAIEHSLCFAILRDDTLVGLARVVTDRATFAYLTDVVIDPAMRGQGLAHRLMEEILGHPDLQGLRRFALITSDAMRLYEDFGFSVGSGQLTYMEKR
jgi:N-acetylglutamate synthase-like GNAT family acetyltransferase